MAVRRRKYRAGLTFVEMMIATVILLIAVLGASAFRYDSALSARKADLQATAARTALLLCESWRAVSDSNTFDPTQLVSPDLSSVLAIAPGYISHQTPEGFTLLGIYEVGVGDNDGVGDDARDTSYYAVLSYRDVSAGLRALNVTVIWDQRGSGQGPGANPHLAKSFRLTTFVEN